MTYAIYQYTSVTPQGVPIEPPASRDINQAFGGAIQLAKDTIFVAICAELSMHLRISSNGAVATAEDHVIPAGETRGFPVQPRSQPSVYGVLAS